MNHKGRRKNSWNCVKSEVLGGSEPLMCVIISVCSSLLSSEKTFSYLFFHCFFLNNARISCVLYTGIFFPHDKFLHGKFPLHNPLFSTPLSRKIPLKMSVHFPITITICKHWPKFVTCSPSHGDSGGVSRPQRHSYKVYQLCWIKWLSQNFDPVTLGK